MRPTPTLSDNPTNMECYFACGESLERGIMLRCAVINIQSLAILEGHYFAAMSSRYESQR